eukprot:c8688_g1_i2.p2 GENE.c8688_g1_i2~~c8688_g1_i2.p2  ORF type:complete len:223 (+),score=42.61 c8688_g1_i2:49-717(+)
MAECRWKALESNPDVMNQWSHSVGLPESLCWSDIFGFDEDLLAMVPQPSHAVILLRPSGLVKTERPTYSGDKKPWYMTQTDDLGNACGTIAMVHAMANHLDAIPVGPGALRDFVAAAEPLGKDERGTAFDANEPVRTLHNACAAEGQTSQPDNEDDVSAHFICFTAVGGELFELDGRKPGPISHGPCADTLRGAMAAIRTDYMEKNPEVVQFVMLSLGPLPE